MPPIVASAPGSTEKNTPSGRSRASSWRRVTPACTVTSMSATERRTISFIWLMSTQTPPWSAATWPSRLVPAPKGTIGVPCSRRTLTTGAASSVEHGYTTKSGAAGACQPSSLPWRRSSSAPVVTRSAASAALSSSCKPIARHDRPMAKRSAGILLYRRTRGLEVLLVHPGGPYWAKKDLGAWSIPKGEHDEGEDARACAIREFTEETGGAPSPGELEDLGTVKQKAGKIVQAWALEGDLDAENVRSNTFSMQWPPRSGQMREFPEVDRAQWFPVDQARERINPAQAVFLDRLTARFES